MRWRFADRIDEFHPWAFIRGRKGISLEEYSLLERFGRSGVLPETLVLESCVHFARWLVSASSEWNASCLLKDIMDFTYESEARMGNNLRIDVSVKERAGDCVWMQCAVSTGERSIARGRLVLDLVPLANLQDPESLKILWQELYGKA